ncbi:MAG: biotin-dependent carboxyltransferase [Deltaproteobacteria bacterium]|nr:biotin-dependent carboxyltransferase [Deltaproteobacteria bacterium]MBW2596541.1 biotin-dependent carboxyltransferase [Deltaproteobacteria bacterium]MBW2649777.1 biotin-dependent carboxyltransferase [Deltaproteobacteria bacterium]
MMDAFLVQAPGSYTTVQDKGRFGYQKMGIPVSGVLDSFAGSVANMLVGNPEESAVLEITVVGPRLAFLREIDVALAGAEMGATLNNQPVNCWESFRVSPGDILRMQQVKSGCRAYLAISGGIEVPEVLGSRSTCVGGKLGGCQGRPLKKGDILSCGEGTLLDVPRRLPSAWIPRHSPEIVLRAVPGPQDDFFHEEGLVTFFQSEFTIGTDANRMGYRLQGPSIPHKEDMPGSIISEPSISGNVQIPADGQPIILLAEQTMGGYTKIATVISTDIPKIAQAIPGNVVRFEKVTLETAHSLYMEQKKFGGQVLQ